MYLLKMNMEQDPTCANAKWALGQRYPRDKHGDTHPGHDVKPPTN